MGATQRWHFTYGESPISGKASSDRVERYWDIDLQSQLEYLRGNLMTISCVILESTLLDSMVFKRLGPSIESEYRKEFVTISPQLSQIKK